MGSPIYSHPLCPPDPVLGRAISREYLSHPLMLDHPARLRPLTDTQTGGYDGSMLNGLNILPSYTDYFQLTAATTGLNTASVFIGGFLGPLVAGVTSDRLGRRPTIFWGSLVTIIGIILQTAAQNIAMFVVGRIILGFGTGVSGVAAGVYLSETFPSRWRAWGVGLLNDFYYVGALIAAGITLGTGQWQSTWAWRAPSLFQGIFSVLCIVVLPFIPESPRWLAYQGLFEASREVCAQTNANGDPNDPVVLAVYKEIIDTLAWEKKEGKTLSPMEIVKTPAARKRFLIGMSPGPFSCIAGNIIASYYLGPELDTAGITDTNDQLKAVSKSLPYAYGSPTDHIPECRPQRLVPSMLPSRDAPRGQMGTKTNSHPLPVPPGGLSVHHRRPVQEVRRQSGRCVHEPRLRRRRGHVPVSRILLHRVDAAALPLPARGHELLHPCERRGFLVSDAECSRVGLHFHCMHMLWLITSRLIFVFIMPIGLANIGWKMYMVNASWDIVIVALIVSIMRKLPSIQLLSHSHIHRPSSGSRQRVRPWKKSTQSLKARNTPTFLMLKRFGGVRRL